MDLLTYMDYHPGGWEELVRGAGIDATNLFNEVHKWVNYESMLKACLIGKLVSDPITLAKPISLKKKADVTKEISPPFNKSPVIPPISLVKKSDTLYNIAHDWYQTDTTVVITLYTKTINSISKDDITVEIMEDENHKNDSDYKQELRMTLRVPDKENNKQFIAHRIFFYLENKVQMTTPSINVTHASGKVDVKLSKSIQSSDNAPVMWKTLGFPIKQTPCKESSDFRSWLLINKIKVNHNVSHYVLQPTQKVFQRI